jgi:hypothetical protein
MMQVNLFKEMKIKDLRKILKGNEKDASGKKLN